MAVRAGGGVVRRRSTGPVSRFAELVVVAGANSGCRWVRITCGGELRIARQDFYW